MIDTHETCDGILRFVVCTHKQNATQENSQEEKSLKFEFDDVDCRRQMLSRSWKSFDSSSLKKSEIFSKLHSITGSNSARRKMKYSSQHENKWGNFLIKISLSLPLASSEQQRRQLGSATHMLRANEKWRWFTISCKSIIISFVLYT